MEAFWGCQMDTESDKNWTGKEKHNHNSTELNFWFVCNKMYANVSFKKLQIYTGAFPSIYFHYCYVLWLRVFFRFFFFCMEQPFFMKCMKLWKRISPKGTPNELTNLTYSPALHILQATKKTQSWRGQNADSNNTIGPDYARTWWACLLQVPHMVMSTTF